MIIPNIVLAISILVWFITIFTQKKSSVFVYFLMLGISDPISLICEYTLTLPSGIIFVIAGLVILFALRSNNFKSIKFRFLDYFFLASFIIAILLSVNLFNFALLVHVFILINFIERIIITLHFEGTINIFFLVIVFYETSLLIKGIVYASSTVSGFVLFSITLAFQIFIAIFFIIFTEDNPKLIIKMT